MERIHHQQRKSLMNAMLQVVTIEQKKTKKHLIVDLTYLNIVHIHIHTHAHTFDSDYLLIVFYLFIFFNQEIHLLVSWHISCLLELEMQGTKSFNDKSSRTEDKQRVHSVPPSLMLL